MPDDFTDALALGHKFGNEMVAVARQRAAGLGLDDDWQRMALRQAAIELATASIPDGWSMLKIAIEPVFPPGHPSHVPIPTKRKRRGS